MLDRVLIVYSPDDTPSSPSTTNAISDGDEGVLPCPECGKMFKTNRARACHRTSAHYRHKKYHPERCLVLDCKCPACSQEFRSQADAESHFLARACAASRSEAWTEKLKQAWEPLNNSRRGPRTPRTHQPTRRREVEAEERAEECKRAAARKTMVQGPLLSPLAANDISRHPSSPT